MVSIKQIALMSLAMLVTWFLGFIFIAVSMLTSGDIAKQMLCGGGSCFEAPAKVKNKKGIAKRSAWGKRRR